MKIRKKAFTLVELILAIVIGGILITISTNWYITNVALSNNKNNRQVDLQSGVSTTMKVIKNTLKKTTQVHLVGKTVYDPDKTLDEMKGKLDENYNYIALSKDVNGNFFLVNLINNKGIWERYPILAQVRNDNLQKFKISYNMLFYKKDDKYRDKMDRNILNITIVGNAHDVDSAGNPVNSQNDRIFELSQDIDLPNVNQILLSKHMEGGIDQVTAIAYDSAQIQGELKKKVKKMSFVFAIDNSSSMLYSLNKNRNAAGTLTDPSRKQVARASIDRFIKKLNELGKKSDIEIDAYVFCWGKHTMFEEKGGKTLGKIANEKYIYPLDQLKKKNSTDNLYGPFPLGDSYNKTKMDEHINSTCGMGAIPNFYLDPGETPSASDSPYYISGTNTGLALLQSLEILNQLKEEDENQRRFLIFLTDGEPTYSSYLPATLKKKVGSSYADVSSFNSSYLHRIRGFISNAKEYNEHKAGENLNSSSGIADYYMVKYGDPTSIFDNRKHTPRYNSIIPLLYIKEVTKYDKTPRKQKYYNNFPDTFDKAYVIGFSGLDSDKSMLGFNPNKKYNCPWQELNPSGLEGDIGSEDAKLFKINYENEGELDTQSIDENGDGTFVDYNTGFSPQGGSIKKFLGLEGVPGCDKTDKIMLYNTKDKLSLDSAFEDIIVSIGNVMNAFDGPKPLNAR